MFRRFIRGRWKWSHSQFAAHLFQTKKVGPAGNFREKTFHSHTFRGGAGGHGRWGKPFSCGFSPQDFLIFFIFFIFYYRVIRGRRIGSHSRFAAYIFPTIKVCPPGNFREKTFHSHNCREGAIGFGRWGKLIFPTWLFIFYFIFLIFSDHQNLKLEYLGNDFEYGDETCWAGAHHHTTSYYRSHEQLFSCYRLHATRVTQ